MARDLVPHEKRRALLAEAHARPFHAAVSPQRFCHFAFVTDPDEADRDRMALSTFCKSLCLPEPQPGSKHHRIRRYDMALRWEQHTEFTTYTWEFPEVDRELAADRRMLWMHKLPQPGELLVSVDLQLRWQSEVEVDKLFQAPSLAMAYMDGQRALAATDFCPDRQGFVRFFVADLGLSPMRAGALVQRLLELETYRMFALLGLPEAQRLAPEIKLIEQELARITVAMTEERGLIGSHDLLQKLTSLAAQLEAGAIASMYRFAASRAYAEIVQGRLDAIDEQICSGYSSFSSFMSRRLAPAMRTCTAMEERQANLSRKLARAAQLLRTRVEIELEHQNRDLLSSMNARTRLQLRLQETVEVLSIAAASYYVIGLTGHLLVALPRLGVAIDPQVATAVVVPIVVTALALLFALRWKGKHEHEI